MDQKYTRDSGKDHKAVRNLDTYSNKLAKISTVKQVCKYEGECCVHSTKSNSWTRHRVLWNVTMDDRDAVIPAVYL